MLGRVAGCVRMAPARERTESNVSSAGPLSAFSFLSFATDAKVEEEELDESRNDLEGLVQFFQGLRKSGVRLCEARYVVNKWALGGIIPMTHHGFIFQTSRGDFFTLDFGRQGIVWDVFDELPECPDNTIFNQIYNIDMDTSAVQKYCEETPPFNFPFYDCETWAKGMLTLLAVDQSPLKNGRFAKDMCVASPVQAFPSVPAVLPHKKSATRATGAGRQQRTGTCI